MLARYSLELDIVWLSTCSGSLALGVSMLVLARARVFAARSITNIYVVMYSLFGAPKPRNPRVTSPKV